jgi:hypothetical protein
MMTALPKPPSKETLLAVLGNDVKYIRKEVDDIKILVTEKYVTKTEFEPIRLLVYGMVGLVLVAVFGAIVALVVGKV